MDCKSFQVIYEKQGDILYGILIFSMLFEGLA